MDDFNIDVFVGNDRCGNDDFWNCDCNGGNCDDDGICNCNGDGSSCDDDGENEFSNWCRFETSDSLSVSSSWLMVLSFDWASMGDMLCGWFANVVGDNVWSLSFF